MPKETVKWDLLVEWLATIKEQSLETMYAYNIFSDAGTFNGLACSASTGAVLSDRRYFRAFTSWNNDNSCMSFDMALPKSYKAGEDITVRICFTYSSVSAWDIRRWCGLTLANETTPYDWDVNTTYQEDTFIGSAHTDFEVEVQDFTFSGTGRVPWDRFAVVIYRNTTTGNPDTLGVSAYICQVSLAS